MSEQTTATPRSASYNFALAAAEMAANTRCRNVVVLDLRGKSPVTEFFVIATGTSPTQMRTVVDEMADLGKRSNFNAWKKNGYDSAKWIVLDFVQVVAHVFDAESREFYDLELLWGDSPRIDWRAELGLPPATDEDELESVDTGVEGDAELLDDEDDGDSPVMVEVPDESTGSNSVAFLEAESPDSDKGHFPTELPEEEDADAEAGLAPQEDVRVKAVADAVADVEDAARPARRTPKAARKAKAKPKAVARKKVVAKKAAKKKAPAKKAAVKKVAAKAKKPAVKKVAAKKAAPKKAAPKKAVKKAPVKKKPAAKKSKKK